jgi:hypothetical protein
MTQILPIHMHVLLLLSINLTGFLIFIWTLIILWVLYRNRSIKDKRYKQEYYELEENGAIAFITAALRLPENILYRDHFSHKNIRKNQYANSASRALTVQKPRKYPDRSVTSVVCDEEIYGAVAYGTIHVTVYQTETAQALRQALEIIQNSDAKLSMDFLYTLEIIDLSIEPSPTVLLK